jgi:UDP-glucose 4-epimerase
MLDGSALFQQFSAPSSTGGPVTTGMTIPDTIDRTLLQTYLSDHLAGATGGRNRIRDMARRYARSDLGPDLARVAEQLEDEHDHLDDLIDRLGLGQPLPKKALAALAELAGRLKANGRVLVGSPMTPLLEIEVMRSAVSGKQGLWETLALYAKELGLDATFYRRMAKQAGEQSKTFAALHAQVRADALRPGEDERSA